MRFKGISNGAPSRAKLAGVRSEKNLAVAILRQAWHEAVVDLGAVKDTTRKEYVVLKKRAIEWIDSDDEGFPYWCQMADVDHTALRQQLGSILVYQRHEQRVGFI